MRVVVCAVFAACSYDPARQSIDPIPIDAPQLDPDSDPPPVDAAPFSCPGGYATLPGAAPTSLYRISGAGGGTGSPSAGRATWEVAQADCADDGPGVHLAIPNTEAEYNALSDAVSGASRWMGVTDRITDGNWIPIVGGSEGDFIGHWFNTGPNPPPPGGGTVSNCMILTRSFDAGNVRVLAEPTPCRGEGSLPSNQWDKGYICECDMQSVDTSTF